MLVPQILLSVAGVVVLYWLWTRRKYYALISKLPGPLGFPLLGIAPYMLRKENLLSTISAITANHGPCALIWWFTFPTLVVCDPQIVQDVLTSPNCVDKSDIYKMLEGAFGRSLLSLNDPVWSTHRKLLNPAFHRNVLQNFMPIINQEVNGLQKTFEMWAKGSEPVNIISRLKNFTLFLNIRTTIGTSIGKGGDEAIKKVVATYLRVMDVVLRIILSPYLAVPVIRKLLGIDPTYEKDKAHLQQFVGSIIEEKLTYAESDLNSKTQTFLDTTIKLYKQGQFSREEMQSETVGIIAEGFEPTSNSITYCLMLLAMFPEYQEKLFEELLSVFPEGGDFEVTESDLHNLVYLDMVLNESMRVLPPIPLFLRNATGDVTLSNGVVIPAGVLIVVYAYDVHRSKDVWGPEAHVFNPDNFLPINREGKHPYAFLPFSMGIRKCIGYRFALLACKIALAKLVRNYKFSTDFKYEDLDAIYGIVLNFKHMPLLQIEKRTT